MPQARFTKEAAAEARDAAEDIIEALPAARRSALSGALKIVQDFIAVAERAAPSAAPEGG